MKKCIALILTLALMLSVGITCPAAERTEEKLTNGGFESTALKNNIPQPNNWRIPGEAAFGTDVIVEEEDVAGGAKAVRLKSAGDIYVTQSVALEGEKTYTMSWDMKVVKKPSKLYIKFEYYEHDETGKATYIDYEEKLIEEFEEGDWTHVSFDFTAIPKTAEANVLVRFYNGEVIYDNVSILGEPAPDGEPIPSTEILPTVGTDSTEEGNLLLNPSFEELDENGYPKNWNAYSSAGGSWEKSPEVSVSKDVAYDGSVSVKISDSQQKQAFVWQQVQVEPNTTYQLSAWVRQNNLTAASNQAVFKVEYYSDPVVADGSTYQNWGDSGCFGLTQNIDNTWQEGQKTFTTEDGTYSLKIYCRMGKTNGNLWYDKVSLRKVGETAMMQLKPEQHFYYPETETGYARARLYMEPAKLYGDGTVDFALLGTDKATILKEQTGLKFTDGDAWFDFPISLMTERKTAYWLTATLKDAAGNVVDKQEVDIYCYERPTILEKDGTFLRDGKAETTAYIYHVGDKQHENAVAIGGGYSMTSIGFPEGYAKNPDALNSVLDDMQAKGLKAIIGLYGYNLPPAHPQNIEATRATVLGVKDHPAVVGYALVDEPYGKIPNTSYWLKESYKFIRNLDDRNFVYCLDARPSSMEDATDFCDVYAHDPYPSSHEAHPESKFMIPYDNTTLARMYTQSQNKPVIMVNQAFTYGGYKPTPAELRSFWYQTLQAGVDISGWYELTGTTGILNTQEYFDYLQEFAKEEQALSYKLFSRHTEYPTFNHYQDRKLEYEGVIKDGDLYMLIFNRGREDGTFTVSLKSQNGLVTASGTPEELYLVDNKSANPVVNGDTLTVTLPANNISLLKFTGVDASGLADGSFDDLASYDWASEAIEAVYRSSAMNAAGDRAFAPGEAITRGDFAKALIRSLGIANQTGHDGIDENFADVPADSHYAYEIQVGKHLGILRGMGDGNFNPEAPITRQDLMVIVARGMRHVWRLGGTEADLSAFSDNASVADYAESAIAQMIAAEIIKGNADGTLNPLGNTTRAEAAVIMQRLAVS